MSVEAAVEASSTMARAPEEMNLIIGPPLSHEAFERLWLELKVVHKQALGVSCPTDSPETFHAALQLVKIQTLAFSLADATPWKAYMFTRTGGTLILAELLQGSPEEPESEGNLLVSIKQQPENQQAISNFVSVLKTVLQTFSSQSS